MDEDERRAPFAGLEVRGQEELVVELEAVFGVERDRFGDDVLGKGVAGRKLADGPCLAAGGRHDRHRKRMARTGGQQRDRLAARQRRRPGLDAVAPGELPRPPARRGHPPQVAPVDVARVGGVEEGAPVRRERDVLGDAVAGRELDRVAHAPGRRDRVVTAPSVGLGLEDDVVPGPDDLAHLAVDAVARRALPHLRRLPRARVAHPDGEVVAAGEAGLGHPGGPDVVSLALPGGAAPLRPRAEGQPGPADEGDPGPVRRPGGAGVAVDRRAQVCDAGTLGVVDADEAVVLAVAHERQPTRVRRPGRVALAAEHAEERPLRVAGRDPGVHRRPVDVAIALPGDPLAVGGKRHVPGLRHPPGLAARGAHRPGGPLGAPGIAGRVCDPPLPVGGVSAQEHQRRAVIRDAQVGQVAPVIVLEACETHRREVRRGGRVHVALPLLVLDPGDAVGRPGRHQLHRIPGAEHVLDREALRLDGQGAERGEGRESKQSECREQQSSARHDSPPGGWARR